MRARFTTFRICLSSLTSLLLLATSAHAEGACKALSATVEVSGSQSIRRPIGAGLALRLDRVEDAKGWSFEIGPEKAAGEQAGDFVYLLTPPWRGRHVTMLDTSYATPAQDVNDSTPRSFWFLLDARKAPAASHALAAVLWSSAQMSQEQALAALSRLPRGLGNLRVLEAEVVPAQGAVAASASASEEAPDFGAVRRLRVAFTLVVPTTFQANPDWSVRPARCPAPKAWPGFPS